MEKIRKKDLIWMEKEARIQIKEAEERRTQKKGPSSFKVWEYQDRNKHNKAR